MREPGVSAHWPGPRALAGELALLAVIALILAALGPFGSFELGGFGARLEYWMPAAFLGYAIFRPISLLVLAAGERLGLGAMPALLIAVAIAAFPASAAMLWLGGVRFGHAIRLEVLMQLYFQVSLIGALIGAVFVLLWPARPAPAEPARAQPQAPPPAPFLDRLPGHWNGQLNALQMEDHYVRAHGPGGQSVLILMRMADAERELGAADGLRVHRSWWVARDAVIGRARDGRSLRLRLDGGLEAPVARDRAAAVRDWLK
ncbi:LytTR family DNA-binding domain-containing protein [Sphingomonas lutea]|nr:LytTR family DNA-binding domain-containing protein [Sphingomonas lutea]